MYNLVEYFDSFEGEGLLQGVPMSFVRFSRCNRQCTFCDTPFEDINIRWDEDELIQWIGSDARGNNWIMFTGGEPMLSLSVDLITRLRNLFPEKRFAITTNGTVCNPAIFDLIDHIVVSPKLKGLDPYWIHPGILDYFVQSKGYRPGWDMTSEIRITISQDYGDQEQQFEFVKKFLNSSMRVDLLSFSPVFDADVPSNWKPGQGHSDGYRVNLFSLDICEALVRKIHNEYFPQPARVSIQVHKMVNWR